MRSKSANQQRASKIRVLICDDHPMMLVGIREYLSLQPNIEIVGTVTTGEEAVRTAAEIKPDVLVIDISLPDISGIEATKRILKNMPNAKVVLLTMHEDEDHARQFIQSGALGYVLKKNSPDEVVRAVDSVMDGMAFYSPQVQRLILKILSEYAVSERSELTDREREVLTLVASGFSTNEIARKVNLAPSTVSKYRKSTSDKLKIHSIAELTKYAIAKGLIRPPS